MSKETEAKFLSKRPTKRNLEKYVQSLLVECNWNQADSSSTSEVLSQPCTSRSITNAQLNLDHLDLNQNFNLNSDVLKLNTQQQRNDRGNEESVHEIPDVLEKPEKLQNNTSEVFEESEITEKYSDSETLPNTLQDKLKY